MRKSRPKRIKRFQLVSSSKKKDFCLILKVFDLGCVFDGISDGIFDVLDGVVHHERERVLKQWRTPETRKRLN